MKIEMGIGWVPDPVKPGGLVSAAISDYVKEIQRLREQVKQLEDDLLEARQNDREDIL